MSAVHPANPAPIFNAPIGVTPCRPDTKAAGVSLAGRFRVWLETKGVRVTTPDFGRAFSRFGATAKRALPLATVLPSLAMSGNEQTALVGATACLAGSLFLVGIGCLAYFSSRAKTAVLLASQNAAPVNPHTQAPSGRHETATVQRPQVRDKNFVPENLTNLVDPAAPTAPKAEVKPTLPLFDTLTIEAATAVDRGLANGNEVAREAQLRIAIINIAGRLSRCQLILDNLTQLRSLCEDKRNEMPPTFRQFKNDIILKIDSCTARLNGFVEGLKLFATENGFLALKIHLDQDAIKDEIEMLNADWDIIKDEIRNTRYLPKDLADFRRALSSCHFAVGQLGDDEKHVELKVLYDGLGTEADVLLENINPSDAFACELTQLKNRTDNLLRKLEEILLPEANSDDAIES